MRGAWLAIFNGEPDLATKLVAEAKANIDKAQAVSLGKRPMRTAAHTGGTAAPAGEATAQAGTQA